MTPFRTTGRLSSLRVWYDDVVTERERDKRRIDKLLDAWEREIDADPGVETLALAARALVPLLERRSKLLGLDAVQGEDAQVATEKPLDRILRAVPGQGAK